MTREELRQRILELGEKEGVQNIDDVYDAFLKSLELPIESIYDLNDLEEYDDSKDYACYYVWAYTHKCDYQVCFTLNKKQKDDLEEKKNYVNELLDKIEKEEKRKQEEENQKFSNLQDKIVNLCEQLNKEFGAIFSKIKQIKKYSNSIFSKKIIDLYGNSSLHITVRGDKFYLTQNHLTTLKYVYWDFEEKDIDQVKFIINKPQDFDTQAVIDYFYKLLDKLIKELEEEYN